MEYSLRATAVNLSSTTYSNVTATLISAPPSVVIIEDSLSFGSLTGNASKLSIDDFVIRVDLSKKTALEDLKWRVEGEPGGPEPGSGGCNTGNPTHTGIFLSIDCNADIKGEATSASHRDWIDVLSYSEGSSVTPGLPGGSGGVRDIKVDFGNIMVTKSIDRSSPLTRLAVVDGDVFSEVRIDIVAACDGRPYLKYAITLTVSSIVEFSANGSAADDTGTEQLAFNYSRIESMYTPVDKTCKLGKPIFSFQDVLRGI